MVFQDYNLFPNLSVMDNITLAPIMVNKMSKAEAEKAAAIAGNGHQRSFQLMGDIGGKFLSHGICIFQFLHLLGDLFILIVHTHKKRAQLLIAHILQRMLQIQFVNGLDELFCSSLYRSEEHTSELQSR